MRLGKQFMLLEENNKKAWEQYIEKMNKEIKRRLKENEKNNIRNNGR